MRAVSQDPIWRQDLARQELHGGLGWQAHMSAEHSVGDRVHHGHKQQRQQRQHIFRWTRNATDYHLIIPLRAEVCWESLTCGPTGNPIKGRM